MTSSPPPSSAPPVPRRIPAVDRLLRTSPFANLLAQHPREAVLRETREVLARLRRRLAPGVEVDEAEGEDASAEAPLPADPFSPRILAGEVSAALAQRARPYYRRVINATGVVLHTNLGRAPLAAEVAAEVAEASRGAQRLEVDPETGRRGGRDEGCARLLRELTGCEAATVVNNNAAATLLVLAALARGRGVLVSRGELVEIGGSYRIPEVMEESGARLVEVGTTNRTHLADYRRALERLTSAADEPGPGSPPRPGMLLKVHTSNYRIRGFTAEVSVAELAELGREHGVPVVHDLGSGSLLNLAALEDEPRVSASLEAGADLVCFSGDKLLGGPQAGLILGKAEAVERCRRHPLFRALRPGRLVYTALEATLRLYQQGSEHARAHVPALARLTVPGDELRRRAGELAGSLQRVEGLSARAVPCTSQAGSGALPDVGLPSWGVEVELSGWPAPRLAEALRQGEPAVFVRVREDRVLLDLRTLDDAEIPLLQQRFADLQ